jgi:hypothetical protein
MDPELPLPPTPLRERAAGTDSAEASAFEEFGALSSRDPRSDRRKLAGDWDEAPAPAGVSQVERTRTASLGPHGAYDETAELIAARDGFVADYAKAIGEQRQISALQDDAIASRDRVITWQDEEIRARDDLLVQSRTEARKLRQKNRILERALDRYKRPARRLMRELARSCFRSKKQGADARQNSVREIEQAQAEALRRSWLFDANWYRLRYPDIAMADVDPLQHYLSEGAAEGRSPSPFFDTGWYLAQNLDVEDTGVNPLLHYITRGAKEGRTPVPSAHDLLSERRIGSADEFHDQITERLLRDNQALCQVIKTVLERADEVFESRPWRLGRLFARIERPFRKVILRDRRRFRHLTKAYLHEVAEQSAVFRSAIYPVTGGYDDIPVGKVATSVRETLTSLWDAVGVQLREQA